MQLPIDVYLLYCYVGVVGTLIIGLVRNRVRHAGYDMLNEARFTRLLSFFMVFTTFDFLWGLCGTYVAVQGPVGRIVYIISSYGFHTLALLSSVMASAFGEHYMSAKGTTHKVLTAIRMTIMVVQVALLVQNIFTGNYFYVDEAGSYHAQPWRPYGFYLQFLQYLPPVVYAIIKLNQNAFDETHAYPLTIVYSAVLVTFGLMQMLYPDGPFYTMGVETVTIVIYALDATRQIERDTKEKAAALEREKSRQEIEAALHRAEEASRAKTTFLNNMSHDIRTPINGIMGMVSIAKEKEMPDDVRHCINSIDGASRHLLTLINDVLDLSRIESGHTEIKTESANICTLCDNCASIIRGQLGQRNLEFVHTAGCENRELWVFADVLHLRQVLINVLGNAVKFTPDGGSVHFDVTGRIKDEYHAEYTFVVKDTGIGMDPKFIEHIFEEFTQEENNARGTFKGTGLGMVICKKLTDLMDGTIKVESERGKGSTFTITIPFMIDKSGRPAAVAKENDDYSEIKGIKLLLVEDNDLNMEIATEMLTENGLNVTPAENGAEAVRIFTESAPGTFDVILMDIMMPVMNGYEATKAIRASAHPEAKTVPILAMTANAFDEDKQAAFAAGMTAHVSKPIDFGILMREIGRAIKKA